MTTNFSLGISTWRFLRLCWRAPLILITCAGILTRNVEPISQAQPFVFSSEIALSRNGPALRNSICRKDKKAQSDDCSEPTAGGSLTIGADCNIELRSDLAPERAEAFLEIH